MSRQCNSVFIARVRYHHSEHTVRYIRRERYREPNNLAERGSLLSKTRLIVCAAWREKAADHRRNICYLHRTRITIIQVRSVKKAEKPPFTVIAAAPFIRRPVYFPINRRIDSIDESRLFFPRHDYVR